MSIQEKLDLSTTFVFCSICFRSRSGAFFSVVLETA